MLLQCFFVAVLVFPACVAQLPAIANCSNVSPGELPFYVLIQWLNSTYPVECIGAILDEKTILTTAHCCSFSEPLKVVAGEKSYLEDRANYQESPVSEVKIDERYENDYSPTNLCILKLVTPFVFNKNVSAVGLPAENEVTTGSAVLCTSDAISKNTSLKSVALQIIDNAFCQKKLVDVQWTVNSTQICTNIIGDKLSCGANPGSLLVQRQNKSDSSPGNETVTLIGIFSWVDFLYTSDLLPFLFIRISSFIGWINMNRF